LLTILESLLSAIHLMAAGLACGGPLVCVWLEWREHRRGDRLAGEAARRLARWAIHGLWIAMLLGAACLGLLWLGRETRFWQAMALVPARRLWFSAAELAFYLMCMEVYVRGWTRMPRWIHRGIAILAATNLLYHFPLLFAAVSVISRDSQLLAAGQPLGWLELVSVFRHPDTLSRALHFTLAAGVTTGVALMALAPSSESREPKQESERISLAAWGARLALGSALLQVPAGVWVLLRLPSPLREPFLAADLATVLLFATAIFAMLGLLHHLGAAALGDKAPAMGWKCLVLTAALFILMVGAGRRARAVAAETIVPSPQASGLAGSTSSETDR